MFSSSQLAGDVSGSMIDGMVYNELSNNQHNDYNYNASGVTNDETSGDSRSNTSAFNGVDNVVNNNRSAPGTHIKRNIYIF